MRNDQWRIDNARRLSCLTLYFQKYIHWSEDWGHDHCAGCWAKFAEFDARGFCMGVALPVSTTQRVNATSRLVQLVLRSSPASWAGNPLPAMRLRDCGCGILN